MVNKLWLRRFGSAAWAGKSRLHLIQPSHFVQLHFVHLLDLMTQSNKGANTRITQTHTYRKNRKRQERTADITATKWKQTLQITKQMQNKKTKRRKSKTPTQKVRQEKRWGKFTPQNGRLLGHLGIRPVFLNVDAVVYYIMIEQYCYMAWNLFIKVWWYLINAKHTGSSIRR